MKTAVDLAQEAGVIEGFDTVHPSIDRLVALARADEREKYEAIIASMTKLLEAQQKRESVAVDMIAAGIAAERARGNT